jgi:hypothetical protein
MENRGPRLVRSTSPKFQPTEEDIEAHERAQNSYTRIVEAGVKEGQKVKIGGRFAAENDYEIYVGAEGLLYSIMQYDALAIVILHTGKTVITQIEDCLPV